MILLSAHSSINYHYNINICSTKLIITQGQRCWMGMLDGELEETYFQFVSTKSTRGEGPLEQTETRYAKGMGKG